MKRPFCYACLLFILFIALFYICFPPVYPQYPDLEGREVYAGGRILEKQPQKVYEQSCMRYTLDRVQIMQDSTAAISHSSNIKDLNQEIKSLSQNAGQSGNQFYNNQQSENNNSHNTQLHKETVAYNHERIYCYVPINEEELDVGAYVWMQGSFEGYEAPDNPGQFDSQQYYHILGIGGSLNEAQILWNNEAEDRLKEGLYDLKQYLLKKTDDYYTEKYSGVMKTILLGDRSELDAGMKELFKEGGILHILSISGMHISMIGMSTYKLFRKMGVSVKFSAITGLVLVLLYGMMVGSQASTARAIVMFSMQMAAILLGRTYDRMTGLAMAAVLLLLEQPMYVLSSGFLLSFVTVLGIVVFSPMIETLCKERGKVLQYAAKLLSGSMGALLASFPIQLYFFYEYPLYSMIVNVLVLPFLPYIMWFGAAVLCIPRIIGITASPLVYSIEMMIQGYEWVCEKSRLLPMHSLVLGAPAWWQMMIYYGCLFLVMVLSGEKSVSCIFKIRNKKQENRTLFKIFNNTGLFLQRTGIICLLGIAVSVLVYRPSQGISLCFLSVGQGDCAVVQNGTKTYVIDCGSSKKSNVGTKILLPYLKYKGISYVEGVFLSHADADHINGILGWLTEYEHSHVQIGTILLPALQQACLEEEFAELITLAEDRGIAVTALGAGEQLNLGTLRMEVLYPEKNFADISDRNGYSQVLLLEHAGQSMLFTGDIGEVQEKILLEAWKERPIVLLKAAHHGSRFSSSAQFLETCKPEHTVFSYGVGNSYGHPHAETVERVKEVGSELWYTGRQGAILVQWCDDIEINGWKRQ